ncbi:hypothetical protein HHI36_005306 [Cryptolaemus montrouzieri]|uniref:Endonuclease/exonuclease/phosphatase domain-containing protein n=1 Tax=Cryptolaemus montrouzieri TaxID=559131 RepID=A0ABD2NTR4_9CUCU
MFNYQVRLLHLNVQSISNKLTLLEVLACKYRVDILCLSEHWVMNRSSDFLTLPGFEKTSLLGVDVEPTRVFTNSKGITSKSLIDYLVTNLKPECYVRDLLKIRISDHYAHLSSFTLASTNFERPSSCTGRLSTDYSLVCLKDALEMFDWHEVYDLANDVDAAFNLFYAVFLSLFEECCPIRTLKSRIRGSHYARTWLTDEIIKLKKQLNDYSW